MKKPIIYELQKMSGLKNCPELVPESGRVPVYFKFECTTDYDRLIVSI